MQCHSGAKKPIHSELWHACAGPLVTLPQPGSLVYYFPQGHIEQVAVSTNGTASSEIPNYPNLPSQLLCQVHNLTLHADKDTDEIYAQMSLHPVNSIKDVFPIPEFGMKPTKHSSEFFCKTLTASDTSTHGGFSVPRRAAEKLFPQLDFSMQPPNQELVVRDLHDNTWTFRHVYRGKPKRHLLTTGWSMFVGAKRLRAGDAVLFIRDEKSQLLLGVRRANRQQTALPSSVLSADSMHIGVIAAAAHAAANRSLFSIFYNPRACPSEFVIPLAKYRKSVYGTSLSVGMRFGMMFETEDSGKRRYMGTIVGISDLDPLRWPGSKWRSLQVEWDEAACGDKQKRVSPWEIETPESILVFPSLTSGLKRPLQSAYVGAQTEWENMNRPFIRAPEYTSGDLPCPSISNLWSEQLMKMLIKTQNVDHQKSDPTIQETSAKNASLQEAKTMMQTTIEQKPQLIHSENLSPQNENRPQLHVDQPFDINPHFPSQTILPGKPQFLNKIGNEVPSSTNSEMTKAEPVAAAKQLSQFPLVVQCNESEQGSRAMHPCNTVNDHVSFQLQPSPCLMQMQLDPNILQAQPYDAFQLEYASLNDLLQCPDTNEWNSYPSMYQTVSGFNRPLGHSSLIRTQDHLVESSTPANPALPPLGQELWDHEVNNPMFLSKSNHTVPLPLQGQCGIPSVTNSYGLKELPHESHSQSDIYSCINLETDNGGSTVVDPSVSSTVLDEFCTLKDADFQNPSDCFVGNFSSSQDVQSQITSISLADSQALSLQEFADNSGAVSSSKVDSGDSSLLQSSSWQQVTPRLRTYTKIQKAGSVGRSIDVSRCKNYGDLLSKIEHMFGLVGLLSDSGSGWKLVYVDFENDVLLVGDDPWEEFVNCVRCIKILSPSEVQQMGEEGMQLLNTAAMQEINGSAVGSSQTWH